MRKTIKKTLPLYLLISFVSSAYPGLFNNYGKKSAEENIQDLAIEQINNPTDPYVNYNLGVALYQTQKYEQAKNNFDRAILHAKNKLLKERCHFNLGNSCYKNATSQLPVNWEDEKTKIDQEKLGKATEDAKAAIKNYEKLLELNKENPRVKPNLKKAKELLDKLLKKQQQKQDKKDDKQDDKDRENKQDKQQEQNQQQNQQAQQDPRDPKDQKQDQTQEKQQDKQESQQQEQNKSQDQRQQQSQMQQGQQSQAQQVPATAAQQTQEKESAEEKAMRLTLENLQKDEEGLQKAIIQRQTRDQKPLESGQKPW